MFDFGNIHIFDSRLNVCFSKHTPKMFYYIKIISTLYSIIMLSIYLQSCFFFFFLTGERKPNLGFLTYQFVQLYSCWLALKPWELSSSILSGGASGASGVFRTLEREAMERIPSTRLPGNRMIHHLMAAAKTLWGVYTLLLVQLCSTHVRVKVLTVIDVF